METFTVHIQNQLSDILEDLAPSIETTQVTTKLEALIEEIGVHDGEVRERTANRMANILGNYQHTLATAHERVKAELFRLVAQLEYPSRQ